MLSSFSLLLVTFNVYCSLQKEPEKLDLFDDIANIKDAEEYGTANISTSYFDINDFPKCKFIFVSTDIFEYVFISGWGISVAFLFVSFYL